MSEIEKCWLQVTSGQGPSECALAVAKLIPVIKKAGQAQQLTLQMIEGVGGREQGTLLSALLSCEGDGALNFARVWEGTHQWICQSPYRKQHRRKNWFIGVNVFAPLEKEDKTVNLSDITVQTYRSSGPGGQHANKTDSAVRLIHPPTGIVITAQEERSQHMNKKLALARLSAMLGSLADAKQSDMDFNIWIKHKLLERGNPVKVFKGSSFKS